MVSFKVGYHFHSILKVAKMTHSLRDQHADSNTKVLIVMAVAAINTFLEMLCVCVNVQQRSSSDANPVVSRNNWRKSKKKKKRCKSDIYSIFF